MQNLSIEIVLQQACNQSAGIVVQFQNFLQANLWRKRIYAYREKLRAQGNAQFDCLSLLIKRPAELLIVNRRIPSIAMEFISMRELRDNEVPKHILARGKSRVGISLLTD